MNKQVLRILEIDGATATLQGALRDQMPGETPPRKSETRTNDGKPSVKTRCKRGDNATGSNNDTDAKKTAEGTLRT